MNNNTITQPTSHNVDEVTVVTLPREDGVYTFILGIEVVLCVTPSGRTHDIDGFLPEHLIVSYDSDVEAAWRELLVFLEDIA